MSKPSLISDLISTDTKIGLISKDAGSSNIIAHTFNQYRHTLVYCQEPGKSIFSSHGFAVASSADDVYNFADVAIIGTGNSNFEKTHLQISLQKNIETYSVLDHWINYEARFKLCDAIINPSKLLVFDKDANDLARLKFPNAKVFYLTNKYQESIQREVQLASKEISTFSFLYIHEDLPHEFEGNEYWKVCFEHFYRKVCRLHSNFLIRLRIHPKENPKDFLPFVNSYSGVILSDLKLADDIALSHIIVGIRSAALETARNCGKSVYTTNICSKVKLPGPISRLPKFEDAYVL